MTQEFYDVVKLFGAGALGTVYNPDHELNIEKIYKLSLEQGIWHTVYLALEKIADLSKYKIKFLSSVSKNISKKEFIYDTVDELEENGIECTYLKGVTVARFYIEPDCRISGDTDILVDEKELNHARKVLKHAGFDVEENISNMYHFEAQHPVGGILEVHKDLYQKHIRDILFKGLLSYNEPRNCVTVDNRKIKTLGINDELNHLTAHYIKHYITKGAGIRPLMDLMLYIKHYESQIDWEHYNKIWKDIGFYKLIEIFKGIAVKYWNFEFNTYNAEFAEDVLGDIERGGLFGFGDEDGIDFLNVYLAETQDKNALNEYMSKNPLRSKWWRIFPNRLYLSRSGYPYAMKGGVFLFWARIVRLKRIAIEVLIRKRSVSSTANYNLRTDENESEKNRMDLMRRIGLVKNDLKEED